VDPISGTLLALISGAGGEMGKQIWSSFCDLVRRPLRGVASELQISSGEPELISLEKDPSDEALALALSHALAVRAEADLTFRDELTALVQRAQKVLPEPGSVRNIVSGGTVNGPLLQGRDFSNISFGNVTPQPPPTDGPQAHE
jgi:hypothetical protein